jgi:hypothetical protein
MHVTKIIGDPEQPNDECVWLRFRCCDDSTTDTTLTLFAVHTMTPEQMKEKVDAFHDAVAIKHAAMIAGRLFLQNLPEPTKEHPGLLPALAAPELPALPPAPAPPTGAPLEPDPPAQ